CARWTPTAARTRSPSAPWPPWPTSPTRSSARDDHGMIIRKSPQEVDKMRRAGRIVAGTIDRVLAAVEPGLSTADLDRVAEEYIRSQDAVPSFKGYRGFPASICASLNNEVVHGIPDPKRPLGPGALLSLDFGAAGPGARDEAGPGGGDRANGEHGRLADPGPGRRLDGGHGGRVTLGPLRAHHRRHRRRPRGPDRSLTLTGLLPLGLVRTRTPWLLPVVYGWFRVNPALAQTIRGTKWSG